MSSEIIDDIKRATELARAAGYYEGIGDMAAELGHHVIPVVRSELVKFLVERYEANHPELQEHGNG